MVRAEYLGYASPALNEFQTYLQVASGIRQGIVKTDTTLTPTLRL